MLASQQASSDSEQSLQPQHQSIPIASQPPVAQEEKRTSLLDIVRENLQRQGKTTVLNRIVVCGQIDSNVKREEFNGYCQKYFKQFSAETDLITGLLLVMPTTWIHVLEASHKVALSFLRDLGSKPKTGLKPSVLPPVTTEGTAPIAFNQYVRKPKVLFVADDIKHRFYPFWASRIIHLSPGDGEGEPDTNCIEKEEAAQVVTDICVRMMTLGTNLSNLPKSDLKAALDELSERYKDTIPKSDLIQRISDSETIMSFDEWLQIYDGQTKLSLENEHVWPIRKTLF